MHSGGVKHSIAITFSITINKDNQKWIHFLRKNLRNGKQRDLEKIPWYIPT